MLRSPYLTCLVAVALVCVFLRPAHGQPPANGNAAQIAELEKQIAAIEKQIANLKSPAAKKTLSLADANTWRSIRGAGLSPDGAWFAYRVGPAEGDSEMVLRATKGDKEIKLPAGGGFGSMGFSADSKWFAFGVTPGGPRGGGPLLAALAARRTPKVVLVNLASSDKVEMEGYRTFSFNGDAATHIVLRKTSGAGSTAPAAGPGPTPPPGPDSPTAGPATSGHSGTDLVIRELTTGAELTLGNVSEFAFNKKGTWLALLIDSAGQTGNGVQLRDMKTGALIPLDSAKATYQGLTWHENGDAFAVLKGVEDKSFEDGKAFSILGFTEVGPSAKKSVFDPKTETAFPKGMGITSNRMPSWTDDQSALVFGIADKKPAVEPIGIAEEKPAVEPKKEPAKGPNPKKDGTGTGTGRRGSGGPPSSTPSTVKPDLVVWHWQDERLQSQQQVQAAIGSGVQLPVSLPGQGQEVPASGRRRRPQCPARAEAASSRSGPTPGPTSL